jgi:lipoyl synthase
LGVDVGDFGILDMNFVKPVDVDHRSGKLKTARNPVKIPVTIEPLRKPAWIKAKLPSGKKVTAVRKMLRELKLNTVCEDAACPNLGECFNHDTATFMILGDVCTRRCPFCAVTHGKPEPYDPTEAHHIAEAVGQLGLRFVVITSVNRDDRRDGGAIGFADCIGAIRAVNPDVKVEILTPDFRGREKEALAILNATPPDVFNHNIETVPRLYPSSRPGADYLLSLALLQRFKQDNPTIPTKSGLMVGLGETYDEILQVLRDLRTHDVEMLTIGQYLQPGKYFLPVQRFYTPKEFLELEKAAYDLGFQAVASGPMVRSSYHAERQYGGG